MIEGANCTITWESEYIVVSDDFGFIIQLNTVNLSIDTYSAVIKLEKAGFVAIYKTITIIINRIDMVVDTIGFQDSYEASVGERIYIRLNLTEPETGIFIENAKIFYEWEFGVGYFEDIGSGIYELEINLPEYIIGNYRLDLTISKEDSVYMTTEHSFVVIITEEITPPNNALFNFILFILIGVIGILGIFFLRTYVILPQKRRKESELLTKTQRYKDVMNIGAILISIRESGVNIYSKNYFSLKIQNELVSGFVQAITLISDEVIGKENLDSFSSKTLKDLNGVDKMIDLDFKHFNFLICDKKDIRIVFILKDDASERLKSQTAGFLSSIESQFSDKFKNWNGDLHNIKQIFPPLLNKYLDLYYREHFKLNTPKEINRIRKETELSKMESRLLNVIISMTKEKNLFYLEDPMEIIHEKKEDLVIEAIESLLERKIILPSLS
jgi:hypothetical protein